MRIAKVNSTTGIISNFAGSSSGSEGSSGDGGPATSALFGQACQITNDLSGNFYISDTVNNNIRRINSAGIISTYAGTTGTTGGSSGDGGPATSAFMHYPSAMALDSSGNLFFADSANNVVRVVANATGIITTSAGTIGVSGFSGDGGLATAAQLVHPYGVVIDASNNVYISDQWNNRIRKLTATYNYPTSQPSRQPSQQPSSQPSKQPTQQPTRQPTAQPTRQPSRQPTQQPTSLPSQQPSSQPSKQPVMRPSGQPSRCVHILMLPTSYCLLLLLNIYPRFLPVNLLFCSRIIVTRQPTSQPSCQPNRMPSSQPTKQPSQQPTSQPSAQPVMRPSTEPSVQPTRSFPLHSLTLTHFLLLPLCSRIQSTYLICDALCYFSGTNLPHRACNSHTPVSFSSVFYLVFQSTVQTACDASIVTTIKTAHQTS